MAIILSIAGAYIIRAKLISRPFLFETSLRDFMMAIICLIPALLIILAALGLYKKNIFTEGHRIQEIGRLFVASILSVSALITLDFFTGENVFPVRTVAILTMVLSFILLIIERSLIRLIAHQIFRKEYGVKRAVIIGNNKNTEYLINYIGTFTESGYRIAGIVANEKYIPEDIKVHRYETLEEAIKKSRPDVIFQTDDAKTKENYEQSVNHHLLYYFVPTETALFTRIGELELIGNTPAMLVKTTPLCGGYAVVKRLFDIVFSIIAIIIAAIPMLIIYIISKCADIKHSPIYAADRLTQYNKTFKCYKFRSIKPEYSGMTPEAAFEKMGKPELIEPYYKNGQYIKNDPRITKLGSFLRKTSLDELPQLFNILKGDISLVGPRALPPNELQNRKDCPLILTVKSGLTGLAQVSGRRDISFEERRSIDIYYVKNWSLLMDIQIIFKTIVTVLKGEGAK